MNKVFLIGNLTHDPELSKTASGIDVCKFSIAVNRPYTQGDGERGVDFFNCVAWRGVGTNIAKYIKKGNKLAVDGTIQTRSYEDNQGIKRNVIDIICYNVEFLSSGTKSNGNEETVMYSSSTRKKPALINDDSDDIDPFATAPKKKSATVQLQAFDEDEDEQVPF